MVSYASLSQSFNSFVAYATPKLQGTWAWCQTQARKGNAHRISFTQYVMKEAPIRWNQGRTFVIQHQEVLKKGAMGITILFTAWRIYRYWQSLPEYPQFALTSTLTYARVMIGMPAKEKEPKRHIRLVFCIDTSGSMRGHREAEVKKGIEAVLTNAAERIGDELEIDVAIVGFNDRAHEIVAAQALNRRSVTGIIDKVNGYRSDGMTSIDKGVVKACEEIGRIGRKEETSSALILLTDGDDSKITQAKGEELAGKVAALGAQFFAIGIQGFKKETLLRLTTEDKIIDTTKGTSIVDAISILYGRVIGKFHGLRLYCPELSQAGQWSIQLLFNRGSSGWVANGTRGIDLPELAEGETREYQLYIDPLRLDAAIDLSDLVFKLAFKDPRGIEGEATLSWHGGTIVDSAIITPKEKGECFPHFMKQESVSKE